MHMIFCARQLVEKEREYHATVYMLFVDRESSIPHQTLICCLFS